jgi:predicted CXXCH cytochrome family protein
VISGYGICPHERRRRLWFGAPLGVWLLFLATLPVSAVGASPPEEIDPAKSCVSESCHAEITDLPNLHWAEVTEAGQCQRCHVPDGNLHEFETDEEAEACLGCHEGLAERMGEGRVPHEAAEDGCADCHDPHGGPGRALLMDIEGEDLGPLCFGCHDEDIIAQESKHGPAAQGSCDMCHDPHVSDNDTLLRARGAELCAGCHEELTGSMAEAEFIHDPADGDCTDCHNPHSGPFPKMLPAEKRALCDECHDDVVAAAEESPVSHSAATTDEECLNCHDPHATDSEPMLKKPQREVCLGCHDRPLKAGDRTVIDMAAWLDKHEVWHEPIREGNCAGCHQPHGGEHTALLKRPFPETFYAPFDMKQYGLCFSCHKRTLVTTKTTRSLTGFRDGNRNLHFLHVNRKERGRTCRACHEVHASSRPHQVRDRVPYGRWLMPIEFEKSESGGSCSPGCHEKVTYSRESGKPAPRR